MTINRQPTAIKRYTSSQWIPMWQLRFAHLAEHGIHLDPAEIPADPEIDDPNIPEWDLDQIDRVYMSGGGGFWLAWQDDGPVGSVGAQDIGGVVELRRMYVKAAHRRQGIGTRLVQALIDHCRSMGIKTVELWTPEDGEGRMLYKRFGFEKVEKPLLGFEAVEQTTGRQPNPEEIRMQLVF